MAINNDAAKPTDLPEKILHYINGEFVGGCDIMLNSVFCISSMSNAVHQSGELETMLRQAGLLAEDKKA